MKTLSIVHGLELKMKQGQIENQAAEIPFLGGNGERNVVSSWWPNG